MTSSVNHVLLARMYKTGGVPGSARIYIYFCQSGPPIYLYTVYHGIQNSHINKINGKIIKLCIVGIIKNNYVSQYDF